MNQPEKVILHGFDDIHDEVNNPSGALEWYCAPDSWQVSSPSSAREGKDGSCKIQKSKQGDKNELWIWPPAKKDFWRKTYYQPILVKDNGPILHTTLSSLKHYTVTAQFSLTAACQFDQAGICIRFDPNHWIKAGIEVVDRRPRLSCVVTNSYSDWSTQAWPHYKEQAGSLVLVENVEVRIHCRGTSFVVEAKMGDAWDFIRIAHLSPLMQHELDPLASHPAVLKAWKGPAAPKDSFWAGVFACSPEDQRGGYAVFHDFIVQEGSHMEHNTDGNQDTVS